MDPLKHLRRRCSTAVLTMVGVVSLLIAIGVLATQIDRSALKAALDETSRHPAQVALALGGFGAAFVVRAFAWRRVLPSLSRRQSLAGIHLALGANHVLPLRMGEPLRVVSVVRRTSIPLDAATASTVTLRLTDVLGLAIVGMIAAPTVFGELLGWIGWVLLVAVVVGAGFAWRWLATIARRRSDVRLPDALALGLTVGAWLLEAVLVWQSARFAGLSIGWSDALVVTAASVAVQTAALAPGGIGTYEAAATTAYVALGYPAEAALVAAVTAHALKTAYSLVAGGVALVRPAPSLLGRFRLDRSPEPSPTPHDHSDGPVVLFMPAHDEEAAVGACVARVPDEVLGHRVVCLVIDDGSTDATAEVARAAGATVVSLGTNRGLGAAVRAGFDEASARGAAAVVFCDADGEYPPEELEALVDPIVTGEADYVVGSRFLGHIEVMHPHRRLGNRVLTRLLSFAARRPITDGQSGYRAFSPTAARDAEIIHDYNYAQVLTLDLLAKGYRYHEVPISYRFRTTGTSFVRLGTYLRNVVPAVYRELNTNPALTRLNTRSTT